LGDQYISLSSFVCSFLHSPVTSSLIGQNILLSTLFTNTLNLHSSLNVSDQVSHPYKTTGKIIFKTKKINQQNAQINSGLIYYRSITPTSFGPSVEAIIKEFEILESYKAIVLIC